MARALFATRSAPAGPLRASLRRALREVLTGRLAAEDRALIARIEKLRRTLLASDGPLEILDFGAGGRDLDLSSEAMEHGRVIRSTVKEVCRTTSKPALWSLVLFKLIRERRPASCLELGTSLGISAAYEGSALQLNGRGNLVTLEGAPAIADHARRNLGQVGLEEQVDVRVGRFQDTLAGAVEDLKPLDYVFVDGHHDQHATLDYFDAIVPSTATGALLVFDDVTWSEGMRRAWKTIAADKSVETPIVCGQLGFALRAES